MTPSWNLPIQLEPLGCLPVRCVIHTHLIYVAGLSIDWVVTVQKAGMVSIWKVKGLMQHNKRTPTYSMWARFSIASSQSILPSCTYHVTFCLAAVNLKLIALCRSFSGDDRNFPLKFNLYILNMSGSLNCWDCVVDIGETSPKFEMNYYITDSTEFRRF